MIQSILHKVRLGELRDGREAVLLDDTGRYAGLEVVGERERLLS